MATSNRVEAVTLGAHKYEIEPQPIGYLKHALRDVFRQITANAGTDDADLIAMISDRSYDLLDLFIRGPRGEQVFMPRYEFEGFATQEAMDADDYKREYDKSPDPAAARQAIELAFRVNGLDVWKHLGKLLDPTILQTLVTRGLLSMMESSSPGSADSSPPSTPPTSTTGDRTRELTAVPA